MQNYLTNLFHMDLIKVSTRKIYYIKFDKLIN